MSPSPFFILEPQQAAVRVITSTEYSEEGAFRSNGILNSLTVWTNGIAHLFWGGHNIVALPINRWKESPLLEAEVKALVGV